MKPEFVIVYRMKDGSDVIVGRFATYQEAEKDMEFFRDLDKVAYAQIEKRYYPQ